MSDYFGKKHKIKIGTCLYSSACLLGTVSSYSNATLMSYVQYADS